MMKTKGFPSKFAKRDYDTHSAEKTSAERKQDLHFMEIKKQDFFKARREMGKLVPTYKYVDVSDDKKSN